MIVLAGDIGGTNIRLALFSSKFGVSESLIETVYSSAEFSSLESVLKRFLLENEHQIDAAAFVLAGPVVDDQVTITNLGWTAKESEIKTILGDIPVGFYNDLAGISNYIPLCSKTDLVTLNPGEHEAQGAIAVIAPGTGLGEGFLTWTDKGYRAQPSEGGHASFSPVSDIQVELMLFMQQRYQHVSFERVCSGSAIPDLYEFIRSRADHSEPEWLRKALDAAEDQTPLIIDAGMDSKSPDKNCVDTINLFVEILAVEASNMALNVLALGGVYLAGGLPGYLVPNLKERFSVQFSIKGRFSDFLKNIPVYVLIHPQPGLFGAARFAFELAGEENI